MECLQVQAKLSAYAEGSAAPAERGFIEEHLRRCAACQRSLAELMRTIEILQDLPEAEPPVWLTQKVMARVRSEAEGRARKGIWEWLFHPIHIKVPLEAAAVLVIGVITIYLVKTNSSQLDLTRIPTERDKAPAVSQPHERAEQQSPSTERRRAAGEVRPLPEAPKPAELPLREKGREVPEPRSLGGTLPSAGGGAREEAKKEPSYAPPPATLQAERDEERAGERRAAEVMGDAAAKAHREEEAPPAAPAVFGKKEAFRAEGLSRKGQVDQALGAAKAKDERQPQATDLSAEPVERELRRQAAPAAPQAKALSELEAQGKAMPLILVVQNLESARIEVERALADLGARIIRREPSENGISLVAELSSHQIGKLLDRVRPLGEIQGREPSWEAKEGSRVRVELQLLQN